MSTDTRNVYDIWHQKDVPVLRREKNTLRLRLPFREGNYAWLREAGRHKPVWSKAEKFWSLPYSWFSMMVKKCLDEFGQVYVIQHYDESEVCAPACWNAVGPECVCSCKGVNHGIEAEGRWFIVSEACTIKHNSHLSWNLLVPVKDEIPAGVRPIAERQS